MPFKNNFRLSRNNIGELEAFRSTQAVFEDEGGGDEEDEADEDVFGEAESIPNISSLQNG